MVRIWTILACTILLSGCRRSSHGDLSDDGYAAVALRDLHSAFAVACATNPKTSNFDDLIRAMDPPTIASMKQLELAEVRQGNDGRLYLYCPTNKRMLHICTNLDYWRANDSSIGKNVIAVYCKTEDGTGIRTVTFWGDAPNDDASLAKIDPTVSYWPPIGTEDIPK